MDEMTSRKQPPELEKIRSFIEKRISAMLRRQVQQGSLNKAQFARLARWAIAHAHAHTGRVGVEFRHLNDKTMVTITIMVVLPQDKETAHYMAINAK